MNYKVKKGDDNMIITSMLVGYVVIAIISINNL